MTKRRTPEQQLDDLREQEKRLKARIQKKSAQVRSAERKKDTRRKIIAGALALEHAEQDPNFGIVLKQLLREYVTRPEDRALFDL